MSFNGFSATFAQEDTIRVFYDQNWKVISDSAKAAFNRVAYNNENGFWQVSDYYRSGQLQMTGTYQDKQMTRKHGPFEYYYPDGRVKSKSMFMNGSKVDEEISYYKNGQIDFYLRYDNSSKQIEARYFKEDGSESVLVNAEFPGGVSEMYRFLKENIGYPRGLRKQGMEGKVLINFSVNTDGSLYNISVLASPHDLMSSEAVRVVKDMPKWKPAQRDGVPVRVNYNLPIVFNLQ